MPKTIRLNVRLTDEQAQSLSSVKTDLRNDSKVQALGGEVTDHTALRYILFEALDGVRYSRKLDGLESLARREAGSGTPEHDSVEPEERPVVTVEVEEDDPTDEEDIIPVKVYDRPVGWEYYDHGGWEFPQSQDEMHSYYEAAGWIRCAAQLQDRMLELYWHPDGAEQGLAPYEGRDSYNRGVNVQRSPDVGVAHMVPEDWDEPRGATGDIGTWSPG
jgi:hypothetical protein